MIFTRNFYNVHLSHIELFDVGQPRLARYPIHWHHAHYVGAKGKYDDPSSVESLRKVSYVEIIRISIDWLSPQIRKIGWLSLFGAKQNALQ